MLVEIDVSDVEHAWQQAVRAISRGVINGVVMGVAEGAAAALSTGRWKDRTGETRSKTRGIVETITQNGASGEMHSLVKWASWLDEGTSAHWIRPKEGQGFEGPLQLGQSRRTKTDIGTHRIALRWRDEGGGIHFAKEVHHPGTRPTGYMNEAYRKCERVILREVEIGVAAAQQIMDRD